MGVLKIRLLPAAAAAGTIQNAGTRMCWLLVLPRQPSSKLCGPELRLRLEVILLSAFYIKLFAADAAAASAGSCLRNLPKAIHFFFFGTCNNLWQQFMKNFKQLCGCSRSVHRKYEQVEARTGIAQELPLDTIYVVKYRQLG